jgi:hypothetical protein
MTSTSWNVSSRFFSRLGCHDGYIDEKVLTLFHPFECGTFKLCACDVRSFWQCDIICTLLWILFANFLGFIYWQNKHYIGNYRCWPIVCFNFLNIFFNSFKNTTHWLSKSLSYPFVDLPLLFFSINHLVNMLGCWLFHSILITNYHKIFSLLRIITYLDGN